MAVILAKAAGAVKLSDPGWAKFGWFVKLLQDPREATGVYISHKGSRTCAKIHLFDVAKKARILAPETLPKGPPTA